MHDLIPIFGPILIGLVLALWPSARLFSQGDVWWSFERLMHHERARRRAWWHGHHLVDFVRAWGALEFVRLGLSLVTWSEPELGARVEILAVFAVAAVGGVMQLRCPERADSALAPLAYMAGLAFGLTTPLIAGVAVVFALASAFAFRNLGVYFVFLAAAVGGLGVLLQESKLVLLVSTAALLVPTAWVFMRQQRFVIRFRQKVLRERRAKGVSSSPWREDIEAGVKDTAARD